MPERAPITPDGRQEPAKPERLGICARAADLARHQQDLGADLLDQKIERHFFVSMRDRIDQTIEPGGVFPPNTWNEPFFIRTIAGVGSVAKRVGGDLDQELGLQSDQHRRADDIVLVGPPVLQSEFAR